MTKMKALIITLVLSFLFTVSFSTQAANSELAGEEELLELPGNSDELILDEGAGGIETDALILDEGTVTIETDTLILEEGTGTLETLENIQLPGGDNLSSEKIDLTEISDTDSAPSPLEFDGKVGIEFRRFKESGLAAEQNYHNNFSLVIEPSWRYSWDDGSQFIQFTPFARVDDQDDERTHFDIRELLWTKNSGDWTIRAGIGRVFWGVTESQHIVDIINQTDLIENSDTEDKLGQAMINVAYTTDIGSFEFFILPGFRERTFPGKEGRLRLVPKVNDDHTIYESGAKRKHVDLAIRWAHTMGDWDVGLAHFHGTTRDPQFVPVLNGLGVPIEFRAFYEIIDQTSIDVQAVKGSWLWKLEAFSRGGQGSSRFEALAAGFEYTFSGIFESGADLGLLAEYLYDNRDRSELTTPFDDDIYLGTRLGLNDTQSTELLAGIILDRHSGEWAYSIEGSRRIGDNWKISIEARGFSNNNPKNLVAYPVRKDDYIMFELERFI